MSFYFSLIFSEKAKFDKIIGLSNILKITVGDVIKIFYSLKGSNFFFEGFCFFLKRKSFILPDTGISLIAKMKGTVITFSFSFFYNTIFSFEKIDYKKSKSRFRSATITTYKNILII